MLKSTLSALALSTALAAPALAEQICGARADLEQELASRYSEVPVVAAMADEETIFQFYRSADGATWTVLALFTNGQACLVAEGTDWQDLSPNFPAPTVPEEKL